MSLPAHTLASLEVVVVPLLAALAMFCRPPAELLPLVERLVAALTLCCSRVAPSKRRSSTVLPQPPRLALLRLFEVAVAAAAHLGAKTAAGMVLADAPGIRGPASSDRRGDTGDSKTEGAVRDSKEQEDGAAAADAEEVAAHARVAASRLFCGGFRPGAGAGGQARGRASWPKFLRDLVDDKGAAATLHKWVERHAPVSVASRSHLQKAKRAVVAAMLYHGGMLELAEREAAVAVEQGYEAQDFSTVPPK